MKCSHCGADILDDEQFCINCGHRVEKAAPGPKSPSAGAGGNHSGSGYVYTGGASKPKPPTHAGGASAHRPQPPKKKGVQKPVVISAIIIILLAAAFLVYKLSSSEKEQTSASGPVGANNPEAAAAPNAAQTADISTGEKSGDGTVRISDMTAWDTSDNGGFKYYSYAKDNDGNTYDNAVGGAVEDTTNWCEYNVNGEYDVISGVVYLNYEYKDETARYTKLTIYGDNELLFTSSIVASGLVPQNFSVDISGVSILKVCIYGDSYLRLSDCCLIGGSGNDSAASSNTTLSFSRYYGDLRGFTQQTFMAASASSEIIDNGKTYYAENAVDGDWGTSWQEDADGDGIGEFLILFFDGDTSVDMFDLRLGYADYYERNGRPSSLSFEFSDGTEATFDFPDENEDMYILMDRTIVTDWIKITILGAYTGSQWEDTCITEVVAYSSTD